MENFWSRAIYQWTKTGTNPVGDLSLWSIEAVFKTKQLSSLVGEKRNTETVLKSPWVPVGYPGVL